MRKLLFSFCVILFLSPVVAQHSTYLKTLHQIDNTSRVRVIPAPGNEWFLFSLDDFKIYKFSSCGQLEWAQKYSFQNTDWWGLDIIPTLSGGFAFMVMKYPGPGYHALIVNADAGGNVLWCKSFEDASYTEVNYTLMQDGGGNFFLYGNVTLSANLSAYNSLTKISANGNVAWSKLYDHGGTWGGAIRTQDGGFLMRTGNTFIKTDANGNEIWSKIFMAGTYNYYKPVEVADGYIFNGYNNNLGGGDTVSFFKMDKSGALQWGGKKQVNFTGGPHDLFSKYNGNFIFLHYKPIPANFYSTWTEFDKDLNVVNQSAVGKIDLNTRFYLNDLCYLQDSSAIIGGEITITNPGSIPHLAFLKTDVNQHFGCDTSLSVSSTLRPAIQNTISTVVTSRTFSSTDRFILAETILDSTTTYCSNYAPLQLNLGLDSLLCEGSSLILKNKSSDSFDRFVWSTGETTAEINITQSGKYWLRAINSCRPDSISDTVVVSFNSFPPPPLVSDTSICSEQALVLDAGIPNATYVWQDGSTYAQYFAHEPGIYSVDITYLNCSKHFESNIGNCEILTMPNVITPNNDNVNNTFIPIEMHGIIAARLKVFNRWGQEIYASSDIINRPWNGKAYSKQCPDGVYYWIVDYTTYLHVNKVQKGNVNLFTD